jgi:hypothetical protein
MTRATIAGGASAAVLLLLALAGYRACEKDAAPDAATSRAVPSPTPAAEETVHPDFLYGRVSAVGGAIYEGRLRWGGGQEAFWGDYFNGFKEKNPWSAYVSPERLPKESRAIKIFGFETPIRRERPVSFTRPFVARFGDIARIEAHGRDVRVTLKSGTVFNLDRFGASDFDDGVRVWDRRGVVTLDSLKISTIELLPAARPDAVPNRLHGTVHTRQGDFTGFIQWDREECVGTDKLDGQTAEGRLSLPFDTIRSIARHSRDSVLATLLDGRQVVLSDTREVGRENRGIFVDDPRYGRVLVSWDAFERVDFSPGGNGPAYGDFPPGRPLTGSVTTRSGRRLAGRLVYDLDEGETTETLDAPSQGVDYTIPLGLIASIVPPGRDERDARRARVTLQNGEELRLEADGDLGERNGGMLIFVEGRQHPEYVPWPEVGQIDLDRPPAMYPPL